MLNHFLVEQKFKYFCQHSCVFYRELVSFFCWGWFWTQCGVQRWKI